MQFCSSFGPIEDFSALNFLITLFGATCVTISFTNGNPFNSHFLLSVLLLGSLVSVVSFASFILTILSLVGYKRSMKCLLNPLLVYLKIIPFVMAGFLMALLVPFLVLSTSGSHIDNILLLFNVTLLLGCWAYINHVQWIIIPKLQHDYNSMAESQNDETPDCQIDAEEAVHTTA